MTGDHVVPFRRFLDDDSVFGPDDLRAMTTAFDFALDQLGLIDRTDAATELVAKRIIAIAKQGERDPVKLCEGALSSFTDGDAKAS